MPIAHVNHINIRTADMQASARYYEIVFGFKAVPVPGLVATDQALWLMNHMGEPIIHLFSHADYPLSPEWPIPLLNAESGKMVESQTGSIHHVALTCSGLQEVLQRMESAGAEFAVHERPRQNLTQVFTLDPHGILLELNFADESRGVEGE